MKGGVLAFLCGEGKLQGRFRPLLLRENVMRCNPVWAERDSKDNTGLVLFELLEEPGKKAGGSKLAEQKRCSSEHIELFCISVEWPLMETSLLLYNKLTTFPVCPKTPGKVSGETICFEICT